MKTDPWARKLLLDSLSGAPFHEWHDLDDAQHDPPGPINVVAHSRQPVRCRECGFSVGYFFADPAGEARARYALGAHWLQEHLCPS